MPTRVEKSVLKRHSKAIVHMRSKIENGRFGLVLGAGVSKSFKIPNWKKLVNYIAKDPRVKGTRVLQKVGKGVPQSFRTQALFQHFKAKQYNKADPKTHHTVDLEDDIRREWREIIRENLYRGANTKGKLLNKHPYMKEYIPVIRSTTLTVNYNFDNTIERMLSEYRTGPEKTRERGYETVWNPHQQFARSDSIIYHPNGFLPANPMEGPSEELIFSEDAYADQLIDTMAGHYATLLHHLSKYTCLFLGLSLEDSTLRHLLRQNARLNPGHYHYYVAFVEEGATVNEDRRRTLTQANFEIYNLITLFLNNKEIKALGRLTTLDDLRLKHLAEELGVRLVYCYYLTGPVSVGKSTVVSYFKSLSTLDEWFEERLPLLARRADKLTPEEKKTVDSWLARQFSLKNMILWDQTQGIYIIDRCPLDPVSFTEAKRWKDKANLLRRRIARGQARKTIRPGCVILLIGNARRLTARARNRNKDADLKYIKELQSKLKIIYSDPDVTVVDTFGFSTDDVVRRVAYLIYMEDKKEIDLHDKLLRIEKGEIHA